MAHIVTLAILVALFVCGETNAQVTTGTISGLAKDTSGAVVPGVGVTLKNVDTGVTRTVTSDAAGRFHAPNLPVGNYEIQAQLTGFRTEVRRGVQLSVGQEAVVDFSMNVGEVNENVTVQGEAPIVETTNAAITGLVDDRTIRDLPLNGRSFDQLVLLQVGTSQFRRATAASGDFLGGGAKISISGARPQQSSFLLDGTDVNDSRNTMPGSVAGVFLGVETIREFRVLTNSYGAEYGRSAGGVITAITRSGTNNLHGTVFEFLRNSKLDARNFFDPGEPAPFKRNQFGFTFGGPVKKDKTFFFGSYEALRDRLGLSIVETVPDALAHQGILPSGSVGIAPGVAPWLALYPLPNARVFGDGTGQHIYGTSKSTNENFFTTRLDHNVSEKLSLFGRYTFDAANQNNPGGLPPAFLPIQRTVNFSRNQYLTIEGDTIFSQSTLNTFRFGYNRSHENAASLYRGLPADLTFVPGMPFENGGFLTISGIDTIGNQRTPQNQTFNLFEWSDDINHTRGRHTLKAGVIVKRIRMFRTTTNGAAGVYNFPGGLSAFLQARPTQFVAQMPGFPLDRDWRQNLLGFYGTDDFKLTPRLTVNLGLREEFMTGPSEVHGKAANLKDVMATTSSIGNPLIETHKKNIAPRVGFAWDSLGNSKLVMRGGFGLFYDQPFPTYWVITGGLVPPFSVNAQVDNPRFPDGFTQINPQRPTIGDIRPYRYTGTTYAMQYDFTIQTQLTPTAALTVGYAGSQGRHLVRTGQMNIKVPQILSDGRQCFNTSTGAVNLACPNAPRDRRNPIWGDVRIMQTDANSNYNALVLSVNKRLHGGFQLGGSYTYSKIMSDADTVFGSDGVTGEHQVMDPYNIRRDRAPASYSEKHNMFINYTYNLPSSRPGALGKVINGWQVNGITRVSSGAPFPVNATCCSGNGSTGQSVQERPDLLPGSSNNPTQGTSAGCGIISAGRKVAAPDYYFDQCVFVPAVRGFYGNLGRNTLFGPGLVNFDFSLVKNTAITERLNLQFRSELFNVFNHTNFSTPPSVVFNAGGNRNGNAAVINKTDTSSRQIQFSLKMVF